MSSSSPTPFPSSQALTSTQPPVPLTPVVALPDYVIKTPGIEPPYAANPVQQAGLEQKLLDLPTCDPLYLGDISPRTYQLNIDKQGMPDHTEYDSNYQSELQCTVSGMTDVETKYLKYKLKKWITNVRMLASGANGTVYEVFVRNYPWFVIKTLLADVDHSEEDIIEDSRALRHGAVVGLFAVNRLRTTIPTFMHTYGVFTCGIIPAESEQDGTIKVCDPKGANVPHVILENIRDATPLTDFAITEQCTVNVLASLFLQIISAIRLAHREFDFTHYDLLGTNVLIQSSTTPVAIKITGENLDSQVIWHQTNHVARIIDLDMAHATVGQYNLGTPHDLQEYGIEPHFSHPGYDIIKLIVAIAQWLDGNHRRRTVYQFYEKWKFLSTLYLTIQFSLTLEQRVAIYEVNGIDNDVLEFIGMKRHPIGDHAQSLAEGQTTDADNLIYEVQKVCQDRVHRDLSNILPPKTINTADNQHMMGWKEYTTLILDDRRLPDSIIDYFLAVSATKKYTRDQHQVEVLNWLGQVNYQELFNAEYSALYQEIAKTQQLLFDNGATPEVTDAITDLTERGSIWITAVQATAPPNLLTQLSVDYIPGLKAHFDNLQAMLKLAKADPTTVFSAKI